MKYLVRLLKKRYIVTAIIMTVLFGFLGEVYNIVIANRLQSMVIEFDYPGAEKGLNPDGSVFEISDIKAPEILEKAKENLKNNNIDTDFLRSRITVQTKISSQSMDRIVSDVHNEANTVYMPTTFYVYYSQKNKLSKNESELFMKYLSQAYTEYFAEKYSEKNDVLIFNRDDYDFSGKDFLEIYTIFKNKVESMDAYIKTHQSENRAFYTEDKVNLGMAAKKIESFRDINLENFYAFIVQNSVAKNNVETVKRTDYLIFDRSLEYRQLSDASDIARNALQKYESGITAVAFIPSVDKKRNYYMSRTKTGIDDLTKQSYNDGMDASKKLKDIDYYYSLYGKFAAVGQSEDAKIQVANVMIEDMSEELESISRNVLKTDNEYLLHKTMNYFRIHLQEKNWLSIGKILKSMILGFALALLFVLFNEFWKRGIRKRMRLMQRTFRAFERIKEKE